MYVKQAGTVEHLGAIPAGLVTECPGCKAHLESECREPGAVQRNVVLGGEQVAGWEVACILCGHKVFFLQSTRALPPQPRQLAAS